MNKKTLRGMLLLFLATWTWGVAFVAQSVGSGYMNAFAFNCIRNLIGCMVLLPFILLRKKKEVTSKKTLLLGGMICGFALCVSANLQQLGIAYSTVGKSAFITTLYIIFVPIFGIFLKKKIPFSTWIGVACAMIGLYLLCMKNEVFVLELGDIYLLLCACSYAVQILLVDYFVQKTDGLLLSALQFFFCGIFSGIGMFFTEVPTLTNIMGSAIPLLYAGACSTGIGFTLQVMGQKDVPAPIASLIMSLESVVAALAGWVLLHEVLSQKELFGCSLVFAAILLTQLPIFKRRSSTPISSQESS